MAAFILLAIVGIAVLAGYIWLVKESEKFPELTEREFEKELEREEF